MKVEGILIGEKTSEHMHRVKRDIEPVDLLKVLRFISVKGSSLATIYEERWLFYTNAGSISSEEFEDVYANGEKNLTSWLDRFTRSDLVTRVGSAIRIITSTTKAEIIQRIARDKEILFRFFKSEFTRDYCSSWYGFKMNKELLPAASDTTKTLIFYVGSRHRQLLATSFLQYWQLGNDCDDLDFEGSMKTGIVGERFVMNLKDDDEHIIRQVRRFAKSYGNDAEFALRPLRKEIGNEDLEISEAENVEYSLGLHALVETFGLRRISRLKTFGEGLKKRRDLGAVDKYVNKRFIIAASRHSVYCGISHDESLFEKIAWHLRVEYVEDRMILCRVVREETPEAINALWEILGGCKSRGWFYFIET